MTFWVLVAYEPYIQLTTYSNAYLIYHIMLHGYQMDIQTDLHSHKIQKVIFLHILMSIYIYFV